MSEGFDRRMPQEVGAVAAEDLRCGDHPAVQLSRDGREKEEKAEPTHSAKNDDMEPWTLPRPAGKQGGGVG